MTNEHKEWVTGTIILVLVTLILNVIDNYVITAFNLSLLEWWGIILTMILVLSGIHSHNLDNDA